MIEFLFPSNHPSRPEVVKTAEEADSHFESQILGSWRSRVAADMKRVLDIPGKLANMMKGRQHIERKVYSLIPAKTPNLFATTARAASCMSRYNTEMAPPWTPSLQYCRITRICLVSAAHGSMDARPRSNRSICVPRLVTPTSMTAPPGRRANDRQADLDIPQISLIHPRIHPEHMYITHNQYLPHSSHP